MQSHKKIHLWEKKCHTTWAHYGIILDTLAICKTPFFLMRNSYLTYMLISKVGQNSIVVARFYFRKKIWLFWDHHARREPKPTTWRTHMQKHLGPRVKKFSWTFGFNLLNTAMYVTSDRTNELELNQIIKSWGKINCCWFKPLRSTVVCYTIKTIIIIIMKIVQT